MLFDVNVLSETLRIITLKSVKPYQNNYNNNNNAVLVMKAVLCIVFRLLASFLMILLSRYIYRKI